MSIFNFKKKRINSKLPAKQAERLDYMTNNSAYNPDYERAGEITKTDKSNIYDPFMHGEKFAVEVDGDDTIVAVLPLHSKTHLKRTKLTDKRRVLANEPGTQYVDKRIATKDFNNENLKKSKFRETSKSLRQDEISKIKIICKSEENKRASKIFRREKK